MRKFDPRATKRSTFFTCDEDFDEVYELATKNMPIKSIADWFGCSYQTVASNTAVIALIHRGWAEYRHIIEDELLQMATVSLESIDPTERAIYAGMKTKAAATLHKNLHKDPFVPPQELERVRRLSDDELAAELEKAKAQLVRSVTPRDNK